MCVCVCYFFRWFKIKFKSEKWTMKRELEIKDLMTDIKSLILDNKDEKNNKKRSNENKIEWKLEAKIIKSKRLNWSFSSSKF